MNLNGFVDKTAQQQRSVAKLLLRFRLMVILQLGTRNPERKSNYLKKFEGIKFLKIFDR